MAVPRPAAAAAVVEPSTAVVDPSTPVVSESESESDADNRTCRATMLPLASIRWLPRATRPGPSACSPAREAGDAGDRENEDEEEGVIGAQAASSEGALLEALLSKRCSRRSTMASAGR